MGSPSGPQLRIPWELCFLTGHPRKRLTARASVPILGRTIVALGSAVCPDPTLTTLNRMSERWHSKLLMKEQLVVPSHKHQPKILLPRSRNVSGGWKLQAELKIPGTTPCYLTINQSEESLHTVCHNKDS